MGFRNGFDIRYCVDNVRVDSRFGFTDGWEIVIMIVLMMMMLMMMIFYF